VANYGDPNVNVNVNVAVGAGSVMRTAGAAALIAAFVPARRVAHGDPASVYRR
jgi:hypothetical protein